jgi:hypothetical protein
MGISGSTKTILQMKLVLFIKQEVGIMESVVVLCLSVEIVNQEKLVTSQINTMFIELMNMVTFLEKKQ